MALYKHGGGSSKGATLPANGPSEFEILKNAHRFLRDGESSGSNTTWDDQLAQKYYDNLYREFALCDLKHYKSGNFALRWRTESEVLAGTGESTCANTRCTHHTSSRVLAMPPLVTLELPFAYVEHGEARNALVKVVLCERCCAKMMWKRRKEREREMEKEQGNKVNKDAEGEDGDEERDNSERRRREQDEDELEKKAAGNRFAASGVDMNRDRKQAREQQADGRDGREREREQVKEKKKKDMKLHGRRDGEGRNETRQQENTRGTRRRSRSRSPLPRQRDESDGGGVRAKTRRQRSIS